MQHARACLRYTSMRRTTPWRVLASDTRDVRATSTPCAGASRFGRADLVPLLRAVTSALRCESISRCQMCSSCTRESAGTVRSGRWSYSAERRGGDECTTTAEERARSALLACTPSCRALVAAAPPRARSSGGPVGGSAAARALGRALRGQSSRRPARPRVAARADAGGSAGGGDGGEEWRLPPTPSPLLSVLRRLLGRCSAPSAL